MKKQSAISTVAQKHEEMDDDLGYSHLDEQSEYQNFVFGFGCQPNNGVQKDTKMVSDLCHALLTRFDSDTLICEVPDVFNDMKGTDTKNELVTSSTIQKVNLFYSWNIAIKTIGVVFVNTHIIGEDNSTLLEYLEKGMTARERGDIARQLFESQDLLGLDSVEVCTNYSKEQILSKIDQLQATADAFNSGKGKSLGIFIYNIGYKPFGNEIKKAYNLDLEDENFCHEYIFTTTGEVVCLNEYGCRLARNPQVHVIVIQDSNASQKISETSFIHPDVVDQKGW